MEATSGISKCLIITTLVSTIFLSSFASQAPDVQGAEAEVDPQTNPQTDHNHPLHLQASDTPGVALIPMKLTGPENYGVWSRSMRLALLVKNKLGFVDGTCAKSTYRGDLAIRWERCDAVVLSWISAAVAPELMTSIMYAPSSKKIWSDFKVRFDKSNLTRIFYLWKEISVMSQGTNTVTTYYSKMRDLWDEMDIMVPSPSCDCAESSFHVEHVKQQRLLQFLVGLNESFAQVRSSILIGSTVPSVNQAYAIAIQEESQRKLGLVEGGKEPLTMLAGKYPGHNIQTHNFQTQTNNFHARKAQGQGSQGRRLGLVCEHCGYKGHTKESCYRIVGFPADFKSKKKIHTDENIMPQANISTADASNSGRIEGSGSGSQFYFPGGYFRKEQYDQVLKMLDPPPTGSCKANAAAGSLYWRGDWDW